MLHKIFWVSNVTQKVNKSNNVSRLQLQGQKSITSIVLKNNQKRNEIVKILEFDNHVYFKIFEKQFSL